MENEQKKMEVFGFLKDEEKNNRTVCTSFLQHCSSRVLRENSVIGQTFRGYILSNLNCISYRIIEK